MEKNTVFKDSLDLNVSVEKRNTLKQVHVLQYIWTSGH